MFYLDDKLYFLAEQQIIISEASDFLFGVTQAGMDLDADSVDGHPTFEARASRPYKLADDCRCAAAGPDTDWLVHTGQPCTRF